MTTSGKFLASNPFRVIKFHSDSFLEIKSMCQRVFIFLILVFIAFHFINSSFMAETCH